MANDRNLKRKRPQSAAPSAAPRNESRAAPFVVGIVASAGGLNALKKFFEAMPADSGVAFIVVPHLDPKHKSLMAPLLAKSSRMPIAEATEGVRVEPDKVYVIPPDRYLALRGGAMHMTGPVERGGAPAMDAFLRSLADDQQERAVCVVLSGTGTYGTLGLKAVKAAGGMAMVQEPRDAEYPGMPESAVATGLADYVLPVRKIPEALVKFAQHARGLGLAEGEAAAPPPDGLSAIIGLLRGRTKFDFRFYRRRMLLRRVQRRMGLGHVGKMEDYIAQLRRRPEELNLLAKDLLISVTSFFRDPEAYDVLKSRVLPALLDAKRPDEPLRVWVPGCATGEEAYSVAMLLIEQIAASGKGCPLQVFATDVDTEALDVARRGVYPETVVEDVGAQRFQRFFTRVDVHKCQVSKLLRDVVIFAPQNLLADAPFSRLDFVTCRNVLIYLEPEVQERVVALLHFALNPHGYMMLGPSESIGRHTDLFNPVSKKWRVYRRAGAVRRTRADFPIAGAGAPVDARLLAEERAGSLEAMAQALLIEEYAPAVVLTNRSYDALYYWGPTERFLQQRPGAPTQDLTVLARGSLGPRVRAAVHKALRTGERVSLSGTRIKLAGRTASVRVSARPVRLGRAAEEPLVLLAFHENGAGRKARKQPAVRRAEESMVAHLEHELKISREELQSTIEELESSNEELKASNEEVMSMNEELQSANEELETSKEELQSMNEELATVNSQLQEKLAELESANDDMANLLNSADFATIFLQPGGIIARFTPAATRLFKLIAGDLGRPISDISRRFTDEGLEDDVEAVLRDLTTREKEVRTDDDHWFLRRISPYRTHDSRILGVVLSFAEVTPIKRAERSLREFATDLETKVAERTEALTTEIAARDRVEAYARKQRTELLHVYRVHTAGALAASVAHELNQPLAAIASYCEAGIKALHSGEQPSEKLIRNLEQALAQTQRAAAVIRDLRSFLAQEAGAGAATDLNEIARTVRELLVLDAEAAGARIELDLAEGLHPVIAGRVPLEHVMVNLIKNSLDSIHDAHTPAGAVRIATRQIDGHAQVSIADNGPGLSAEAARRSFDAFFSTKDKGLGMGLSVCRSIVASYGGKIWIDPPNSGGAKVSFTLPLAK